MKSKQVGKSNLYGGKYTIFFPWTNLFFFFFILFFFFIIYLFIYLFIYCKWNPTVVMTVRIRLHKINLFAENGIFAFNQNKEKQAVLLKI